MKDVLRDLIEYQIAGGVRLLVPCGTTGESATMTDEEDQTRHQTDHRSCARVARKSSREQEATQRQRRSNIQKQPAGWAPDAVLSVAPYYNKPTQEGLYAHFRAIAESVSGLPVVIYNVPGRTSSNISAATTVRLARGRRKTLWRSREASGNLFSDYGNLARTARRVPCHFRR